MKAQSLLGLKLRWLQISTVFVIDVAVLALASNSPDSWQQDHIAWWVGVGVAVLIAILGLVTYRGITLGLIPFAAARNWYAHPKALVAACTQPIEHRRRFGRDVVGIREYDDRLVTVIAVGATAAGASGRHHHPATAEGSLPVAAIVSALRQFDVRLDDIDIVSVATQADRSTWLVLRMDPQHNVAAVAARDSLAATLTAATERLAHDLDGRSCQARPLNAAEIAEMDDSVLAGLDLEHIRSHWSYLDHPDGYVTSAWVTPRDITGELLGDLQLSDDADVAVVTVRFTARRGTIDMSAFVRYHSRERLPKSVWRTLNRLTGRQLGAIRASLPAPATGRRLPIPSREVGDDEQFVIRLGEAVAAPAYNTLSAAGMAR